MRNPDLPKLLRAVGKSVIGKDREPIFEQAAIELEKLEKIYKVLEENTNHNRCLLDVQEILNEAP